MIRTVVLAVVVTAFVSTCSARCMASSKDVNAFVGNWALRLQDGRAGWLSIERKDGEWSAELWAVGQPKAISEIAFDDGVLSFKRQCRIGEPDYPTGPPTGKRIACRHEARVTDDSITIVMMFQADGEERAWTHVGKRMPPLPPQPDLTQVKFGDPIKLFDGESLGGWSLTNSEQINGWEAVDGELRNTTPKLTFDPYSRYGNLRTEREFMDFNLKLEFKVPQGGNSGVYLRGVYEAQVVDRDSKMQGIHGVGAIFNRIEPSENAGNPGEEWQSYDITLVDRHVTVILNGVTVIDNEPLAGCTNGALNADETVPGPIYLQGDHTAVSYRNIVVRPVIADE